MPKHPHTRPARPANRARAIAIAVARHNTQAPTSTPPAYMSPPPRDARRIGIEARTPARCSCALCRPAPYKRPTLACIVAAELETY